MDAHPRPKDDWQPVVVGMDIHGGGQVRTGSESSARLELLEGAVRLSAESIFTVKESATRQGKLVTTLFLESGRLWANLTTGQPHEFTVETGSALAAVRDTRFSVKVVGDTTLVSVAEGEVELAAQEQSVTVVAGQQATVELGQPPSLPVPMSDEERALWATEGEIPELAPPTPTITPVPTIPPVIPPTATTTPLAPGTTPLPLPTQAPMAALTPTRGPRTVKETPAGEPFAIQLAGNIGGDVPGSEWRRRIVWETDIEFVYDGGPVYLTGSPDGLAPFEVDDAIRLTIARPDGSVETFHYDNSSNCTRSLRAVGPFELTDYFALGGNMVHVEIIDMCATGWGTDGLWLVEFR